MSVPLQNISEKSLGEMWFLNKEFWDGFTINNIFNVFIYELIQKMFVVNVPQGLQKNKSVNENVF